MATKGPPPTYTETCTQCGAVFSVSETMFVDGVNKRCPRCGGIYTAPIHPGWSRHNG